MVPTTPPCGMTALFTIGGMRARRADELLGLRLDRSAVAAAQPSRARVNSPGCRGLMLSGTARPDCCLSIRRMFLAIRYKLIFADGVGVDVGAPPSGKMVNQPESPISLPHTCRFTSLVTF